MNIVYNCNEKYAVHTAVSITSLFENNRECGQIRVYVLGNSLSASSCDGFKRLAGRYASEGRERSIEILELKDYESAIRILFGGELNTGSFDLTVLARLFAPSHLPGEVERYLYLDADTVVLGDLSGLYETAFDGAICCMAAEPTIYADTRKQLGLAEQDPYFNSGMMLVDRIAWEQEKISGKCIDYFMSLGGKGLAFPDQDIINYVLKGRIRPVPQEYNFFSNYHYQSYRSLCGRASWYADLMNAEAYEQARRHPVVMHFAGAERPWIHGNRNPYREAYRHFLELSGMQGYEEKGRELEMAAYHAMNVLTQLCPKAREIISKLYFQSKLKSK